MELADFYHGFGEVDPKLTRVYNMEEQDSVYYHNGYFVIMVIVKVKSR